MPYGQAGVFVMFARSSSHELVGPSALLRKTDGSGEASENEEVDIEWGGEIRRRVPHLRQVHARPGAHGRVRDAFVALVNRANSEGRRERPSNPTWVMRWTSGGRASRTNKTSRGRGFAPVKGAAKRPPSPWRQMAGLGWPPHSCSSRRWRSPSAPGRATPPNEGRRRPRSR